MLLSSVKRFISKIIFPTYTHEKVYVIEQEELTEPLVFSPNLKMLGKWYITTGEHWICHSELTLEEFQKAFITELQLDDNAAQKLTFTTDYLPFSEILGL